MLVAIDIWFYDFFWFQNVYSPSVLTYFITI